MQIHRESSAEGQDEGPWFLGLELISLQKGRRGRERRLFRDGVSCPRLWRLKGLQPGCLRRTKDLPGVRLTFRMEANLPTRETPPPGLVLLALSLWPESTEVASEEMRPEQMRICWLRGL